MNDILTMVWKESKDSLFQGGWRSLIRPLFVVAIMGIYLPLQFGPRWVDLTPIGMVLLLWVPFFVSSLCLGHGRAQFTAGPGVSRPVSYPGKLDVLSSRSVRGCDHLTPAHQCAWSKRGRADIAESIDGAAGTANSERRHDSVCIRDHLCTESRACECFLIVNLFAVFAHCNGGYCRAGCDLAWIIAGELPTFALNLELRKHAEIKRLLLSPGTLHFVTACATPGHPALGVTNVCIWASIHHLLLEVV